MKSVENVGGGGVNSHCRVKKKRKRRGREGGGGALYRLGKGARPPPRFACGLCVVDTSALQILV